MAKKNKASAAPKKSAVKAFTIKKYALLKIADWLANIIRNPGSETESKIPLALHGPEARARNNIRKVILERASATEDQRMEIVKKYVEKDKETGEPKLNPTTGRFDLLEPAKFNDEFMTLMMEQTSFDILPSNVGDWAIVKELMTTRFKSELTVEDTTVYEDVCQAFEAI